MSHVLPDKVYIALKYRMKLGNWPNIENPKGFNEKIQWLKLYDRKPEYTTMVDKYEVKKYISERIGEQYIIPTLGVWDKFEDIDFEILPDRFVLKCTHNSGGLVICKDKSQLDYEKIRKDMNASLKSNYFWHSREWPYKNVKPRIIAEQYMENEDGSPILDYKVQCLNGEVDNICVCVERFTATGVKYHIFDEDWNYLPYYPYEGINAENVNVERPEKLPEMLDIARKLAKDIPEIRVDLYEIKGQVYFGELTFCTSSGFDTDISPEADLILGSKLVLPKEKIC